jgi:Protein of unknown function (DUF3151).
VTGENLLPSSETRLPEEPEVQAALAGAAADADLLRSAVAAHPDSSLAWAALADVTFDPQRTLESYAYARVGYHRGLDALRKAGWRGAGTIPWTHPGNRGVLRSLYALRRAADAIGERAEVVRLTEFLTDADPTAATEIESARTAQLPTVGAHPINEPAPTTEAIVIRGEE